ncbi:hypothetical protein P170DRAFT_467183 [Aspergillus steynii IBT 23096]|uniref:Uncharacterized protein n=1 Tax=Aspergillus steynii IBT 23096 TaxID=1392250 RepID=A0A2I2FZG1_9EURO|nr:uncharacterized protein P170DRAFT_467183 [Aspergillus steynii IBT 23096]PLB46012.1 hypothetical protein P170DRAFT_467183 [Aspergillus steynii IBT 23096]
MPRSISTPTRTSISRSTTSTDKDTDSTCIPPPTVPALPTNIPTNTLTPTPAPDPNNQCPRNPWETTGAITAASAKGFGKFLTNYYKGVIVDSLLAAMEGLCTVPRLYGEEVEEYTIHDWNSGAATGGKNFTTGMRDGFTGVWTQPMQVAAAEEGAIGVAKGIMKGAVGLVTKVPSAALGLVAYPAHGICKSIHTAVRSTTRKQIAEAQLREGNYFARGKLGQGVDRKRVI